MSARRRPRLGQHFLRDPAIIARILDAFHPQPADCVVEIGPGDGALTRALAPRVARLHAVELDQRLAAALATALTSHTNVTIHQGDALAFDFCAAGAGEKLRVIGNLPYAISTPLLFRLLDHAPCLRDMCFMLQREVVERICAVPGTKAYGRLSVMLQWRCAVRRLFNVKPGAFSPPPNVDSSVVHLQPYATPPVHVTDELALARVVGAVFAQRRKTLRNALRGLLEVPTLQVLGIEPGRRGETLSIREFAALADALALRSEMRSANGVEPKAARQEVETE